MELTLTLRNKQALYRTIDYVDRIQVGSRFTMGFDYSENEMFDLIRIIKSRGVKVDVLVDNFIFEDEKMVLVDYLEQLSDLNIDGLVFHDLGVLDLSRQSKLRNKLIYDGKSVMCNSFDAAFMLNHGVRSVQIANELMLNEMREIIENNPRRIDLQIFGHQRMSFSHRHFLKNYFTQIGKEYDYLNKKTLSLKEEKRDYLTPIYEDRNGTSIFTDYILLMYEELPWLADQLNRAIVETIFIDDIELIRQVVQDYRRITVENRKFLKESLVHNYPRRYSSGYLYQKININKDEQD